MLNCNYHKHEDNRRTLIEWIENENFVSSKIVIVKEEIPIGDHYHNNKDEIFFLLSGKFKHIIVGEHEMFNVSSPYKVEVRKGQYHKFVMEKGSVLLGVCSKPFDVNDEIKLEK